jgi:hypothetical protein
MKRTRFSLLIGGLSIFIMLMETPALATEVMKLAAKMDGSQVVPPTDSKGTGAVDVTYDPDTKTMDWTLKYSNLSGKAIGTHFHGPANPGKTANVAVPIPDRKSGTTGSVTLTEEQASDLMNGKYYVDIHTATHAGGEIRGQVLATGE